MYYFYFQIKQLRIQVAKLKELLSVQGDNCEMKSANVEKDRKFVEPSGEAQLVSLAIFCACYGLLV